MTNIIGYLKRYGATFLVVVLLFLSGCAKQEVIEAPEITCSEITVEQGSDFWFQDYCSVLPGTHVTASEVDTSKLGDTSVHVVLEYQGAMTIGDVPVHVVEAKEEQRGCGINAEFNKETKECECKDGYEMKGDVCVPKVTFTPTPTATPEPTEEPTPEPTVEPTPEPTPEVQQPQQTVPQQQYVPTYDQQSYPNYEYQDEWVSDDQYQ